MRSQRHQSRRTTLVDVARCQKNRPYTRVPAPQALAKCLRESNSTRQPQSLGKRPDQRRPSHLLNGEKGRNETCSAMMLFDVAPRPRIRCPRRIGTVTARLVVVTEMMSPGDRPLGKLAGLELKRREPGIRGLLPSGARSLKRAIVSGFIRFSHYHHLHLWRC